MGEDFLYAILYKTSVYRSIQDFCTCIRKLVHALWP